MEVYEVPTLEELVTLDWVIWLDQSRVVENYKYITYFDALDMFWASKGIVNEIEIL